PSGQMFDKWVVNGVVVDDANSATTTFVMPAGNVTAEATYKDIPVVTYTVTFNANGGTGSMADATGVSGDYVLPVCGFTAPNGKQFKAWNVGGVEKAAGAIITVNANTTVTAVWENIPVTYYTVTFDSNGGSAVTAQTIEEGQKATKPADPTKSGYDFKGWTLNGSAYDFNTAVNGNITLVATWEQQQVVPTVYTVTFDSNGGSAVTAQNIEAGQKAVKPADPTKAGYDFKGWTLNGSAYDFNTAVNGNITLIAVWEQQVVPATYTVSFDANGGTGTMADVTGISGEYTLPANGFTAPSGQQFKAWNVGGSEYAAGAAINVAADTTVKAVWKTVYTGGGYGVSASYGVTVLDCVGADVKVSDKYAYAGEKITITIVPEQGKRVDTVAVADKNGKAVEVSCTADGTYTFKMPKSKVTVQVQTVDIIRIEMALDNPCILFNGEPFVNDVPPVLIHDRTMVPVSVITAMLGGTSEWDGTTRQVTLHLDGQTFVMTIDQVIAGFDVAPIILDSRTYVPVGYIMGVLGADVQWIGDTREVIIQK
ncbi:MAG: InlB B-repeat-containing protein, partial [Peptococcaceae bacterium]|nr:InlB B-repeat-containing protein [Peptococcaceae bacterium]